MPTEPRLSLRWRVAAPLAAATASMLGRYPVVAAPATPVAVAESAFGALLGLAPVPAADGEQTPEIATFADIAAQLAALGVAAPASVEADDRDAWIRAISPLALGGPFATRALLLTRSLLGFDLTDVDQMLQIGQPPEEINLLRGRFDRAAIAAAWTANGYHSVDVSGIAVASLNAEPEFDLQSPIGSLVLAAMNNAAFLPDGTLAYTASLDAMRGVIDVATGATAALGQRFNVAELVRGVVDPLASAMLVSGVALAASQMIPIDIGEPGPLATEIAAASAVQGEMPPVLLALFGSTPGGPLVIRDEGTPAAVPDGEVVIRLLLAEPGSAERAKQTIETRLPVYRSLRTNVLLSEYFAGWEVRALPDGDRNLVELRLRPAPTTPITIWLQMVFSRDLGFLAW